MSPSPDAPVAPDAPPPLLTAAEMTALAGLSPLPAVPADTTNAYAGSAAAARLGQMLFFDKSYSGTLAVADDGTNGGLGPIGATGKVSCASCHAMGSGVLDDRRSTPNNVSLGTDFGTRNALGIINSSFYAWTNWGGRFDSQWSLPLAVAENAKIMNATRLGVAHLLYDKYRTEYAAAFATQLDARLVDTTTFAASGKPTQPAFDNLVQADKDIINRIFANYGKAIAAYMRTLVSRDAPFDRFAAGDHAAISPAAVRGFKRFVANDCMKCHSGPHFTDDKFHALGVAQTGPHVPAADLGRNQDVGPLLTSPFNTSSVFSDDTATHKLDGLVVDDAQKGQFRTKSLRNVAQAGPFMHSGQLATLADVVAFYDRGGDAVQAGVTKDPLMHALGMTAAEQADLVEFLGTLTGGSPPIAVLVDTSK
jgi:cytochrome c peroxidase